jgi:hypothetical protein
MRAISEKQLRTAIDRAGLPGDAFQRILVALDEAPQTASSFETAHISYYLGALLIIGAMGWFVTSNWDRLSGIDLFGIALAYAALFGGLGVRLFRQLPTRVPGFHPRIDGNWVLMELATIVLSAFAVRWIRFPFITAPAAYALWYLSLDVTALLLARTGRSIRSAGPPSASAF